ncbi:aldo/keto reductase [Amycolatopsis keratiniphila]|uniref:Putative oxidoreductase, aryl-alcohol dehydrogenase like protein n=1 Tax=Amycolatopsis keratiniphila TaxID=129921 RepID=R4SZL4_9PSEU|nr:aldo/keto reductase [Amycolatopsis keratiniphila]AGM07985.1 putative oxidoreductase, aryl-alcohol dehydrogenase like protein [Amycolatopsis keratiniphila]
MKESRRLGESDLIVSPFGLGTSTWGTTTDHDAAASQLAAYLDAGGNLLDTADVYGAGQAERIIGRLLGTGIPRESLVLATKSAAVIVDGKPTANASSGYLLNALDASLSRLGTDHIDLWQLHAWDRTVPIDESLKAIETAIAAGKVRNAGVCNYSGWQTAVAAVRQAGGNSRPLASVQVEYSLLERGIEREVVPAATNLGLGILPWAPLGRGVLSAKYRHGVPEKRAENRFFKWYVGRHLNDRAAGIVEVVASVADELGTTPVAVSLAWLRDRPGVVAPLIGARTVEQLEESLAGLDLHLPEEHRRRLDEVSAPRRGYPEVSI